MIRPAPLLLGVLLATVHPVLTPAAQAQPGMATVSRVQMVDYDPDATTTIRASLGYQVMVEFAVNERIENVSIGDAMGWQVTPNKRANILFLKPVDGAATNMTVVTDRRRYLFDLRVAPRSARGLTPYSIRFIYPAAAPVIVLPEPEWRPEVVNAAYVVEGSGENTPERVFDDGVMTYFEWRAQAAIPAIFAVAADGTEGIVNATVRGPYTIVQQLAGRFVLRHGKQVATVTNTTYPIQVSSRRQR